MKRRTTFYNWLNNRYQLIIRSDENFAEKYTFSFSYAKLIVLGLFFVLATSVLSYFVMIKGLANWFDPGYERLLLRKDVIQLRGQVDSLSSYIDSSIRYNKRLKMVLQGKGVDSTFGRLHPTPNIAENELNKPVNLDKTSFETQFANEVKRDGLSKKSFFPVKLENTKAPLFFYNPLVGGLISGPFDAKKQHFGIDLVTSAGTPVKAVSSGVVLVADMHLNAGNILIIQHKNGYISVYQHNSSLQKKKGDYVDVGEIIAIIGGTGKLSNGAHLHFELWHKGIPLDPSKFISF